VSYPSNHRDELAKEIAALKGTVERLSRPRSPRPPKPSGTWTLDTPVTLPADTYTVLTSWTPLSGRPEPRGITVDTAGAFTPGHLGWWEVSCALRFDSGVIKYVVLMDSAGGTLYKASLDSTVFNVAISTPLYFDAGETLRVSVSSKANASNLVRQAAEDAVPVLRAVYYGP
jgi:hypothetical protein